LRANGTGSRFTIRLIGEWLLDVAIVIAVESTMLEMSDIYSLPQNQEHTIFMGYT
jgi:hypothetical protein